jgi:hypothetical protein
MYLLLSIVLSEFATKLSFTRASKAIDHEAFLGMAPLLRSSNVEHVFKFLQLPFSTRKDATDRPRNIEKIIQSDQPSQSLC